VFGVNRLCQGNQVVRIAGDVDSHV
jgi:hypothetical protein